MKVGIIGSNGFVGKHLAFALNRIENIELFLFGKSNTNKSEVNSPYYKIDVYYDEILTNKLKQLDVIYYLASSSIPLTSWENPQVEITENLLPFLKFLEIVSVETNVKKIVFISSAGTVYGSSMNKLNEDTNKLPFSPYGINKLTMEYYLNYFNKKNNINYDIFRVSNVYGQNQDTTKGLGIINTFLENIIQKKDITVYGNGETIRNYIYIKDVVSFLLTSLSSDLYKSNIYNLSSDDNLSINNLLEVIKSNVKEKFNVIYINQRNSDNPYIVLDNDKIKSEFSNIKFTPINDGIVECYKFLKNKI